MDRLGRHKRTWVRQKGTQHAAAKDLVDQSQPTFHKEVCLKNINRSILLRIGDIVINDENG